METDDLFEPNSTTIDEEFARLREERQKEVDRLSLELLSNSKQYKKYVAKNHPDQCIKNEEDARRFSKLKPRVAGLFMELLEEYDDLENGSSDIGVELQNLFKECVQKSMQHIEWSDHKHLASYDADPDEDMLFAHAYRRPSKARHHESASSSSKKDESDPFSFWGATIRKSSM